MPDPLARFDLDNPVLPDEIADGAMTSGGYPYSEKLEADSYDNAMYPLQKQLVALQAHLLESGERVMIVLEGRDAAGKGGVIKTYLENLNPRRAYSVALPKPSDRESTQWYFQRYVDWLPAAGETVLFDRSYYNRAGVELVMGFCTPEEAENFLKEAPRFEQMLTDDGIHLFKFYLDIGREMQLKRFHDRRHDPLKSWKLTAIDYKAIDLWDAYSSARDKMLRATSSAHAPWTVVRANDKRRARLSVLQCVLGSMEFAGKVPHAVGEIDRRIILNVGDFLLSDKD